MQHPGLAKIMSDAEYERRHSRLGLIHLLTLMPLLVLAALVWTELGSLVMRWVPVIACLYLVQLVTVERLLRREILSAMRREGLIDADYRPPVF